ncbi:MAG: hypothetical protein ABSH10_06615 [Phycisphaerae bacterium]|jgi:hypothetical protein
MNRRATGTAWLALAAMLMSTGCQQGLGWLAANLSPPEKVKALYKPPEGKKILVFVDDVLNPVTYEPIKGELTEQINEKLVMHKIAASTVPYDRLTQLRSETPNFDRLSVAEVGQKLNVDLVLYVHIDKFSLRDETNLLWQGRIQTTVRLVDVIAGRLWPQDQPEGYSLPAVELPPVDNSSGGYEVQVAKDLASQMADHIAEVFYDHTQPVALQPSGNIEHKPAE